MKIASRDKYIELAFISNLFKVDNNGLIWTKRGFGSQILENWQIVKLQEANS